MFSCSECKYLEDCKENKFAVVPCACITKSYPAWIDPNGAYTEYQHPTDGKFYKEPWEV